MATFKRIEQARERRFRNEFGRDILLQGQGGNCTAMGNPDAMKSLTYRMVGPQSEMIQTMTILEAAYLRDLLNELLSKADYAS